jgi:hypothetical protein
MRGIGHKGDLGNYHQILLGDEGWYPMQKACGVLPRFVCQVSN